MQIQFFKKNSLFWLYAAGVLLLAVSLSLVAVKNARDPERVFWQTFKGGLSAQSVTVNAKSSGNGVDINETLRYSFGADSTAHSVTDLSQNGTRVRNEMISTQSADYTRYLSIQTSQRKKNGSKLDFSKLLGVWAKDSANPGQSFSQAVFGGSLPVGGIIVPVGNLAPSARQELTRQAMQDKVYQIQFEKVKKVHANGRLQYVYDATISPFGYVSMMKRFAQLSGLHQLDTLNPADYKQSKSFEVLLTIDVRSRRVIEAKAPDSGSQQTYSDYGIPVLTAVPKQTITMQRLQQLLTQVQQ